MPQPPAHTTYTSARSASGPSRDKRGKRPPHHHTLSLLGSAGEMQRDPLGFLIRTQQSGEVEAQLILSTVAQRYQVRLIPGHPVEPQMVVTLRPRYGLPMTIHATERAGSQQ